jgi:hypothetical protein
MRLTLVERERAKAWSLTPMGFTKEEMKARAKWHAKWVRKRSGGDGGRDTGGMAEAKRAHQRGTLEVARDQSSHLGASARSGHPAP